MMKFYFATASLDEMPVPPETLGLFPTFAHAESAARSLLISSGSGTIYLFLRASSLGRRFLCAPYFSLANHYRLVRIVTTRAARFRGTPQLFDRLDIHSEKDKLRLLSAHTCPSVLSAPQAPTKDLALRVVACDRSAATLMTEKEGAHVVG
jgi:hypothetical protein